MAHDYDELKAHAAEARDCIVLFVVRFDQHLADNGRAMNAYEQAGEDNLHRQIAILKGLRARPPTSATPQTPR